MKKEKAPHFPLLSDRFDIRTVQDYQDEIFEGFSRDISDGRMEYFEKKFREITLLEPPIDPCNKKSLYDALTERLDKFLKIARDRNPEFLGL